METKKDIRRQKPGESNLNKVGKSFLSMFNRKQSNLSVLEEEALQTPGKTILKNFLRNKLGILGLIGFVLVMCFSFVGSYFMPLNLTFLDTTLRNIRPGSNYLNYPNQLSKEGIKDISSGVSFSIALSQAGNLFVWGTEPTFLQPNISTPVLQIPSEVRQAKIVQVAAGDRHVIAMDDQGKIYGWGQNDHKQAELPTFLNHLMKGGQKVKTLFAGESYSAILFDDGELYVWGATMATRMDFVPLDPDGEPYQGRIVKTAHTALNIILLLDDGTITVMGVPGNELTLLVPEQLKDGSVNIVDLAVSNRNGLALDDQGRLHIWGGVMYNVIRIPEFSEKVVAIDGGKNNFTALLENGQVVYWGANHYKQLNLPKALSAGKTVKIFSDFYQNYALQEDGSIVAWGNKGFILGSDQFGRDNLTRLIHGGRISLTVGAIAVIISTIIALFVGMTSGFFGGLVDNVMMRLTEVVSSIPFLPLAITLSVVVGNRLSESQRIYMIMIILGVLSWPGLARLVRAQVLLEREKDFALAARALGVKKRHIIVRHIMPNILNLVLVSVTLGYAGSLLTEAGLSFLGFGVSPPTPSWGNMLTGAQTSAVIRFYWWRWMIPGLAVVLAALSINLVGDALRDAMDPKANEK